MTVDLDLYWQKVHINGDEKAFKQLFKQTFQSLCFYAFQISSDRFLAEEIVQDVFVKLWENRESIEVKGNFKAYLFQMVHNFTLNKLVFKNTQKNMVNNTVSDDVWETILESEEYNAFLEEKLEADDTRDTINAAIDQLPNQCREIFQLSRIENKTNDEIASFLDITVNTVRTQIYRALEKIKEAIEKNN
jgi:RNA polymerase sigma-70 factor, ECF subfamily